mmetsp:Transcript_40990/g.65929  ORF Transcript_40990/g.65929 Transcript_40990/m.65929 type:complete len:489 (-) Transcript_40990:5249-6715(-)
MALGGMFHVTDNKNVRLALLYTGANSLAVGIWGYTVLSGFLQKQPGGDNAKVGLAEGIQGAMQAVAAVPAGFLADKLGRECVLKGSSLLGLISVIALLLTLTVGKNATETNDEKHQFFFMCVSLGLWGMYTGASMAPLEAIFHDSISAADRTKVATAKYVVNILFNAAGPFTSILLFLIVGDQWKFDDLTKVMCVGIALSFFPVAILFMLRDEYCLGRESEPLTYESPSMNMRTGGRNVDEYFATMTEHDNTEVLPTSTSSSIIEGEDDNTTSLLSESIETDLTPKKGYNAKYWVPRIVVTADIISGLASGMTIKFFPLFFKDETHLQPTAVNLINVISPILMVIFSTIAMKLSHRIGRVKVPILTNTIGISLLICMYIMGEFTDDDGKKVMWEDWRAIVPIYLVRTALMNCASPLRKSILMDYVSKENRGAVNSLESVSQFGWSGSAVIGGMLCVSYGYGGSFLATAIIQALALSLYSTLLLFNIQH